MSKRQHGPRMDSGEIWCECDEVTSEIFEYLNRIRIDIAPEVGDTGGVLAENVVLSFSDRDARGHCNGEARFRLSSTMAYRLGRQLVALVTQR